MLISGAAKGVQVETELDTRSNPTAWCGATSHVATTAGHLWQRVGSVSHGVLVGGVASAVVGLLSAGRRGLVALAPRFGALWWSAAACERAAGESGEASRARGRGQTSALGREERDQARRKVSRRRS